MSVSIYELQIYFPNNGARGFSMFYSPVTEEFGLGFDNSSMRLTPSVSYSHAINYALMKICSKHNIPFTTK